MRLRALHKLIHSGVKVEMIKKQTGQKYHFQLDALLHTAVVGRSRQCDVVFKDDPYISARHCRFHITDGMVILEDLSARNKTFLNERMILEPQRIADNDVLRIGNSEFTIRLKDL